MACCLENICSRGRIVLESFSKLDKLDVSKAVASFQPLPVENVWREDKKEKGTRIKELAEFGWKSPEDVDPEALTLGDKKKLIRKMKSLMTTSAKNWDFEMAAKYRDLIAKLS